MPRPTADPPPSVRPLWYWLRGGHVVAERDLRPKDEPLYWCREGDRGWTEYRPSSPPVTAAAAATVGLFTPERGGGGT